MRRAVRSPVRPEGTEGVCRNCGETARRWVEQAAQGSHARTVKCDLEFGLGQWRPLECFHWRLILLDLHWKNSPLPALWRWTGAGFGGQADSWVHRPRGAEWCQTGRKWQAEPRRPPEGPGDQPGCVSFRFLQQICERDLSQDSRGPRPEGAAGALAWMGRRSSWGESCSEEPNPPSAALLTSDVPWDLLSTRPLSSHRQRVPRSVPLPRTSITFHTFALSFLDLGPHLLSSDWGERKSSQSVYSQSQEQTWVPILALPCAGSVAVTSMAPLSSFPPQ